MWDSTTASPSSAVRVSSNPCRTSSTCGACASSSVVTSVSADDNRLTSPAGLGVFVLDALLEQHDALEQRLGTGRAAGDVHVDGHDLVAALRDRVAVPVGPAAVGAAAHGDDVLRVGDLLVEAAQRR